MLFGILDKITEKIDESGNDDNLKLHTYFTNLFDNITALNIQEFCNIFEVNLEPDENNTLSIYGKVLDKIKTRTLIEIIENPETIIETALKETFNALTLGEIEDSFMVDILSIFTCYKKDTTLTEFFEKFDELTIGDLNKNQREIL